MKGIFKQSLIICIGLILIFNASCSKLNYDRMSNSNGQYITDSYYSIKFDGIDYPKGWLVTPNSDSSGTKSANFAGLVGENAANIDMDIFLAISYSDFKNELKNKYPNNLRYEDLICDKNGIKFSVLTSEKDNNFVTIFVCSLDAKTKLISTQKNYPETWINTTVPLVLITKLGNSASEKEQELFYSHCIHMINSIKNSPN